MRLGLSRYCRWTWFPTVGKNNRDGCWCFGWGYWALWMARGGIKRRRNGSGTAHFAEARRIVASWPKWKRNIGHRLDPIPPKELP